MSAALVIASTVGGAIAGGVAGFMLGCRGGGDFNFAPAIYAPVGALAGGFVGVVVGSLVFA